MDQTKLSILTLFTQCIWGYLKLDDMTIVIYLFHVLVKLR